MYLIVICFKDWLLISIISSLFPFSLYSYLSSVQFSSVTQSRPTLCDPMNHSTPGLPVHHQLPEFTQTHVHRVSNAIQPSHPLSSPSPPAPNGFSKHHLSLKRNATFIYHKFAYSIWSIPEPTCLLVCLYSITK